MIIQCTKKVLDKMGVRNAERSPFEKDNSEQNPLFAWHANLLTVDRRKVLFFMNDLTSLCVIYYRPQKKDWGRLGEILVEGLTELMRRCGFHEEVTERLLDEMKAGHAASITKTGDRSMVARMNKIGNEVEWRSRFFTEEPGTQFVGALRVCEMLTGDKKAEHGYSVPLEKFTQELAARYGDGTEESVRDYQSYILDIRMDLPGHEIRRRVEVPVNLDFRALHRVIMVVFGWFDYHMHCFELLEGTPQDAGGNESGRLYFRIRRLYIYDSDDPELAADILYDAEYPGICEDQILLSDVFAKEDWCLYTYDFGDSWDHIITVEKRIESGGARRVHILERVGERPPEDVGGAGGFEEYLRVISDPENPEYENMIEWSRMTRAKEKTDEEINRRLMFIG